MNINVDNKRGLPGVRKNLVRSYGQYRHTSHLCHRSLPNLDSIQELLLDLRELLFPGYGKRQNLHEENINCYVGDILDSLHDRLGEQFNRALQHESCLGNAETEAYEKEAQDAASTLLAALPSLRDLLADDVQAAYDGDPAGVSMDEICFCYPGVAAMTVYRIAHEIHKIGVPLIPRIMTELAHSVTGVDIHPEAKIGRHFFIDHGTGVVIGATTEIGENVKLYQGVTLGSVSFPHDADGKIIKGRKRHPTIKDNVVVYANATILGGKTVIGEGAVIGSNVWLTDSVEANTVVTMEKPTLVFASSGGTTGFEPGSQI